MPTLDATAPLRFGRFLLEPSRRQLCLDNEPVQLSSRAFDILALLAENRHRIVSKDEIFANVWRGVAVEDNNLAVQMSALRRALAEPPGDPKIILTIPGRGYRFIAPVQDAEPAPTPTSPAPAPIQAIPAPSEPAPTPKPSRRALWPALAAALLTLPLLAWLLLPQFRQPAAPRLSIVVLPFRNLSTDPQQDYLADAISDDLTTDLSHIPGSVVIARESADVYKGKAVGAETIGRALHVRYLLEGSLRSDGQVLHVNAQLIDARDGAHLWANRFDVTRDTLGHAQNEIVAQIASSLNFQLVQVEAARSIRERASSPDAIDLYLRAKSILSESLTLADIVRVQNLLEQSIRLAPDFDDAMAELGIVLAGKIGGFDDPTEVADYRRAKVIIDQALTIEPNNAIAITAGGMLAALSRDCRSAIPNFEKALKIDPNQILAHKGLAGCALQLGRIQEMIDQVEIIRRIDPASPRDANRQHQIGMAYLLLGRPHEAITWLEQAGAGLPGLGGSQTALGWHEWRSIYLIAAKWLDDDKSGAIRQYSDYKRTWPRRSVWQLASYDTHTLTALPTHKNYREALAASGMPMYLDETSDFGVNPIPSAVVGSDMDATPMIVPGGRTIRAAKLHELLTARPPPVIIDLGRGAAVIPGALWISNELWEDEEALHNKILQIARSAGTRPIVVMSNSCLGWSSYNTALELVAKRFQNVLWFRGGEEAWAAAGYESADKRTP